MTPRVELAARKLLDFTAMSKYDLAKEAFCDQRTAQRILKSLREKRFVFVVAWTKAHNQWIPVYGKTKSYRDMPKPAPLTSGERYRRYMDEEKSWDQAMKKRAKRLIEKVGV